MHVNYQQPEEPGRRAQDIYLNILNEAPALIRRANAEGHCDWFNQTWLQFTGRTMDQELGNGWSEGVHPDDLAGCWRGYLDALATQQPFQMEYRLRCHTGEYRWIMEAGRPLSNVNGQFSGFIGYGSDITGQKLLESQHLRAQRLESIGSLASGIAHDLNNILAPIVMAVEVMRSQVSDPEMHNLLNMLKLSAERGVGIIRQLLGFARGFEGQKTVLEPKHLLREVGRMAEETFPKSIRISLDYPNDLWRVEGDPTQLHQVLLNLGVNARDAMPKGGTLTLGAANETLDESRARRWPNARPGPYVRLSVRDTGKGIHPALLDKIFEPFFSTKQPGQGTGLGLSTAQSIVKAHGGFLRVRSEERKGTEFQVFLPATQAEAPPGLAAVDLCELRGQGELILVVDDEASVRDLAGRILERNGYQVLMAADGNEALGLFVKRQSQIALVLADVIMPVMDGPTLAASLRRLQPAVNVFYMTGWADTEKMAQAGACFEGGLIEKPFTTAALLQAIQSRLKTDRIKFGAPSGDVAY